MDVGYCRLLADIYLGFNIVQYNMANYTWKKHLVVVNIVK